MLSRSKRTLPFNKPPGKNREHLLKRGEISLFWERAVFREKKI